MGADTVLHVFVVGAALALGLRAAGLGFRVAGATLYRKTFIWWQIHVVCGVLHVGSSLALILLSDPWNPVATVSVTRWTSPSGGTCDDDGLCYAAASADELTYIPTALVCAMFAAASGVGHFVAAADPAAAARRARCGVNWVRWADYGVSASLMIVILNVVCGVVDAGALAATSGLMAALMAIIYVAERDNDLLLAVIATGLYPAVWAPALLSYFGHRFNQAEGTLSAPPFVDIIVAALFAVFTSFAVVFWLQRAFLARGGNAELYTLAYDVLSLIAKTALHWTLFASLLGRKGRLAESASDAGASEAVDLGDVWLALSLAVGLGVLIGAWFVFRLRHA